MLSVIWHIFGNGYKRLQICGARVFVLATDLDWIGPMDDKGLMQRLLARGAGA